jgi:hypothetical protein
MVAEGTIQTPDDVDGLDVSIRIDVSRITMRSGENDLGTWPSGAVTITRIDDNRFAFVAEGDRLLFSPADVNAFAAHPGVIDDTGTKRPRKKRASRVPEAPSAEPESAPAPSPRPAPAAQAPKRITRSRFTRKRSVPVDQPTPGAGQPSDARRPRGNGPWIRMIDLARPYSIFSLDRVPVDKRLRGQDHEHTWDHFAARSSGPSHHLCTICGKIRWR